MTLDRIPGAGWLALVGGGEFTFGETEEADRAWLAKAPPGKVGFLPAASGSTDYGRHFADYLSETFEREVETIPIYRPRDARRGKNLDRLGEMAAIYLGGGVTDHLIDAFEGSPALPALAAALERGAVVVGIAAAAQVFGDRARSLLTRRPMPGFGWLPGTAVEPNFAPDHDRRLRQLATEPGIERALALVAGSAVLIGPGGEVEVTGRAYLATGAEDELEPLAQSD